MTIQEMIEDSLRRTAIAIEKRNNFILDTTGATSTSSMCAWYSPSENRVKITPFNHIAPKGDYMPIAYVDRQLCVCAVGKMPVWIGHDFYLPNFGTKLAIVVDNYWMNRHDVQSV